jgi:F0F1-type ATP synthase membrane subunit c/vacuolar-type H+-ATPase subunit K
MNMMRLGLKRYFFLIVFGIVIVNLPKNAFAQVKSSAIGIPVKATEGIQDGVILCAYPEGNAACSKAYDPNTFGVVVLDPAIIFDTVEREAGTVPVITSGKVQVKVSSINGTIKTGDYISTSLKEGVGQKAVKSGFVLGTALEEYTDSDTEKVGKIFVLVSIRPAILSSGAGANLLELLKNGVDAAFMTPLAALRYFIAAMVVVITLVYGLIHFGKISKSGVEAIGRNPMAGRRIQMSVLMNVGLTLAIIMAGLGLAYLILVV